MARDWALFLHLTGVLLFVGGSIAGLASALALARAGVRVRVLERDPESLPDSAVDDIDTSVILLGKRLRLPVVIASMTGGTERAAEVNRDLGLLDAQKADAIIAGAREVIEGKWDDDFVIDIFQTGSGTSTNMNANEVIASVGEGGGSESEGLYFEIRVRGKPSDPAEWCAYR